MQLKLIHAPLCQFQSTLQLNYLCIIILSRLKSVLHIATLGAYAGQLSQSADHRITIHAVPESEQKHHLTEDHISECYANQLVLYSYV